MNDEMLARVKKYTELQATSGHEDNVRREFAEELAPLVDRVEMDGLGGVFGVKESKDPDAPTVMVAAHMDEVGFAVSQITARGMLKVVPLGGWNPYVVSAQRFTLQTNKGDYPVVSSSIPPHLLRGAAGQGAVNVEDVLFDAGFTSREEAEAYGVIPGDTIVPDVETIETANGENIICKAWDNRYGVSVVLELLEDVKDKDLPFHLVAGANVQEEVGLRGASASVTKFNPDLFLAVDCSAADDLTSTEGTFGHLGEGALVRVYDPTTIMSRPLRDYVLELVQEHDIEHQFFVSKGGTDAGAAHTAVEGIPSAVIGMVARYIHTHQTMFRKSDYLAARQLLLTFINDLDVDRIEALTYNTK